MRMGAESSDRGTLRSAGINAVVDGLFLAWNAGGCGHVADSLLCMSKGLALLALGGLLRRLSPQDQVELGAILSHRVLFEERG